ncbi:hypothetical protein HOLleu_27090 [Holothuria leucospilota]|uniref:Ig-like domain-containing protein n=1 Tax=Holothuria leucospilota TaxID=206669 RepID=A0A9Q1BPX7_HOLLE|nr:hypothetical protein HOLleu_27090 [Holothuria leucospilota]
MMENNFLCRGKHCRHTILHFAAFVFFYGVTFPTCSATEVCPENQTAELGGQGYIRCNFPYGFRSVYWFDNTSDRSPVIRFKTDTGVRSGPGFDGGIYDIHQNGSLVILNVTAWHERVYRAIVYTDVTFDTFLVSLQVIAAPGIDGVPVVKCHYCFQEFYYRLIDTDTLTCSFGAARPPVQLAWFEQMGVGYDYKEMQELNITRNNNGTYNSLATLNQFKDSSNFIHLLICRSTWSQSDWSREKQILLDLSRSKFFSNYLPKTQYMEVSKHAKLQCGQLDSIYLVWKIILPDSEPELIGFHSHAMTETITDIPDVEVSAEGSLIFSSPRINHEGIYACIYGNGQKEEIQMTSVELLIPPSPPYIQITGCDDASHYCVIREDTTKNLTCAVYGAHPIVTLEWIAAVRDEISFFNHKEVFKESGGTYDTILSAEYEVSHDFICGKMILIKCHLYGPLSNIMKAESTALIIPASCRENEIKEEQGQNSFAIALAVPYVPMLIVIAFGIIYRRRRMYSNRTKSAAAVAFYNGGPTADPQDAFLQTDVEEAGKQIPNGKPSCIVKDTDGEGVLIYFKEASV